MISGEYDVVVVGAGNAGMCAALAARESGARVLVLEAAPFDERGGNSRYTAGALRFVYNGVDDLVKLCDLSETEIETSDFGTYTTDKYYDDLGRLTDYRSNPDMAELLITKSQETLLWMRSKGIRFAPMYSRQAFKHEGKFVFWGGLALEAWGGGPGLVEGLFNSAEKNGIAVAYEARGERLIADDDGVHGVIANVAGKTTSIPAKAVVLASGGFEANAEMRTRYLGPGWDLAKVRGTRYNTGGGIRMALDIGAMPYGNWSGCHAVGWDYGAPEFGDLSVGDNFQKHSYPFAIMVNADGVRFCDEGADFRNYTYAKYGREILNQPHQFAWQIFDQQVVQYQRDEYRIRRVTKVVANTFDELADKMAETGAAVDKRRFLQTIEEYNAAVDRGVPYNPTVKDGRTTRGLAIDKTNWAMPLEKPPYEAFCTTCGVTFTFGGLKIDTDGRVLDTGEKPIAGLYAAGELVGGLFYFNYPGGTGLVSGSVFGKIAGTTAGKEIGRNT
jgi:tricarballylate dehydrogenase